MAGNYRVVSSRLLRARLTTAGEPTSNWYLGNFRKAFAYMENWGITVTQAPQNSEAEFTQDIMIRFKASERAPPRRSSRDMSSRTRRKGFGRLKRCRARPPFVVTGGCASPLTYPR